MDRKNQCIIILDYSTGTVIKIHMTREQRNEADHYDDFEEYLSTLEDTYKFRLSDCNWMTCETLNEVSYG